MWTIEDFAILNAQGHRLFWAGYRQARGSSMKVTEAEKAQALQLARAAPELLAKLEQLTTVLDSGADFQLGPRGKHAGLVAELQALIRTAKGEG